MLFISRILRNFATGLVNVVFPYIILTNLHQGNETLGLIYTAATISTAILGFTIGFATDKSQKTTFVGALVLLPISTLLLSLYFNSLLAAFVAAIIGGYSASGSLAGGGIGGYIQPIQSTITAGITNRKDRTFYYGLLSFLAGISSAAGAFTASFPTIFDVLLIATVTSFISVLPGIFVRTKNKSDPETKKKKYELHVAQKNLPAKKDPITEKVRSSSGLKSANVIGKFSVTGMLNGFANGLVIPFLIPFFISVYKIPRPEMGEFTFVSGLIGAFALLLGPRLERGLGFLRGVVATRGATAVLALIFPFVRLLDVSLAIYFILPSLRVMAFPVVQTAMTDMVEKDELGRAFGINQGSRLAVTSGGTAFAGYEFGQSSYEIPFIGYAVVMAANLYLYTRFFSSYRDPFRRKRVVRQKQPDE